MSHDLYQSIVNVFKEKKIRNLTEVVDYIFPNLSKKERNAASKKLTRVISENTPEIYIPTSEKNKKIEIPTITRVKIHEGLYKGNLTSFIQENTFPFNFNPDYFEGRNISGDDWKSDITLPKEMSDDFSQMLGVLWKKGIVGYNHSILGRFHIGFTSKQTKVRDRFKKSFLQHFNTELVDVNYISHYDYQGKEVHFEGITHTKNSPAICTYLTECLSFQEGGMPTVNLNKSQLEHFVYGLLSLNHHFVRERLVLQVNGDSFANELEEKLNEANLTIDYKNHNTE